MNILDKISPPYIFPVIKIIGGDLVDGEKESYGYFVRIIITFKGNKFKPCGGTLISTTEIVTSAHCFIPQDQGDIGFEYILIMGCKDLYSDEMWKHSYKGPCEVRLSNDTTDSKAVKLKVHAEFNKPLG